MIRTAVVFAALGLTACAPAYEAAPQSVYQWERRQREIEAQEAARLRACETMDRSSARFGRECADFGDDR